MRFTLIKEIKHDAIMKPVLTGLLFFTMLFLAADMIVKHFNVGILTSDLSKTLFGSEKEFLDPMNTAEFLQMWHIDIFFMMMILITLCAIFARLHRRFTFTTIHSIMISSIASLIFLPLAFFKYDFLLIPYVITNFLWHFLALYMCFSSLWSLYRDTSL